MDYKLQETIAILSGEIWRELYGIVGNDTMATAHLAIDLAEKFEARYDENEDYLLALESFEQEHLQILKERYQQIRFDYGSKNHIPK